MSTSVPMTDTKDAARAVIDALGARGAETDVAAALRRCTRERLQDFARELGLKGTAKLAKEPLVERVAAVLAAELPSSSAPAVPAADDSARPLPGKFDLGPDGDHEPLPANIPWGYGVDRVTAMAIDPRRLYVYWEVTDAAIATARKALGAAGAGAWLNLRVYDITGRLFDGTNAHSYFDEGVSRDDRQWFFEIGKPTSTTCIELGLMSAEGYFVKIVRSGRVDFPRDAPAPEAAVEWLTVRTSTGGVGAPVAGGAPVPDGFGRPTGGASMLGGNSADDWQGWTDESGFPVPGGVVRQTEGGWEWRESVDTGEAFSAEIGAVEWTGPVHRSEWQAGPFSFAVDAPALLEQHESGEVSVRVQDGVAHVVYGPWQVVIRGTGARAERRVLATWEVRRTIEVAGGVETIESGAGAEGRWEPIAPGASEWRFVPGGASERRWGGASELLLRGGSEVFMVGASERRFRGASERLYTGASERRFRGASERRFRGASERRLGGASEATYEGRGATRVGASENFALGGSENAARASADAAPLAWPARSERDG
ncbi:MAG TPA: DUF4912 domain-containing protein [Polyangia bacterium]|nr:DUF4912 domain-containing protein [Polyangia bacterium]